MVRTPRATSKLPRWKGSGGPTAFSRDVNTQGRSTFVPLNQSDVVWRHHLEDGRQFIDNHGRQVGANPGRHIGTEPLLPDDPFSRAVKVHNDPRSSGTPPDKRAIDHGLPPNLEVQRPRHGARLGSKSDQPVGRFF